MIAGSLVAILAMTSCSKSGAPADSLTFRKTEATKAYRLKGSAEDFESPSDRSFGCQVRMLLPEDICGKDIASLRDSIYSAAFDTVGSNLDAIIDKALATRARDCGYEVTDTVLPDSVAEAVPRFTARFDGFFSVEGDIETMSTQLMSYAVTTSYYLPSAAHGMYNIHYINYNISKGKVLTLADLITPEGLVELPVIIRDYAIKMEAAIGTTDINALPGGDNFYLTPDGNIIFAYQPYEVASYAQGEIQIPVPAYMISQYLTPEAQELLL